MIQFNRIALFAFFLLVHVSLTKAEEPAPPSVQQVRDVVEQDMEEKAKVSGTFDLFDPDENKVRNLKNFEFGAEVKKEGENYSLDVNARDLSSGAMVNLDVIVGNNNGVLEVKGFMIKKVTPLTADTGSQQAKKEYRDADIQNFMKEYLAKQAQFSGSVSLFDEEKNKLRSLELLSLSEQVRTLGVLNISTGEFKDKDSGEMLSVDITVENQEGKLNVQSLRIREVKPASTENK